MAGRWISCAETTVDAHSSAVNLPGGCPCCQMPYRSLLASPFSSWQIERTQPTKRCAKKWSCCRTLTQSNGATRRRPTECMLPVEAREHERAAHLGQSKRACQKQPHHSHR